MKNNIGDKRKLRAKVVREKMIRRCAKDEKERLDCRSRHKQEPIKKGQFNDPSIPMSQEREIVIVDEYLKDNLAKLRELEANYRKITKATH